VHLVMRKHLQQLHEVYGREGGVRVARKHIGWYLEGRPGAQPYRAALMAAQLPEQQFELLAAYFVGPSAAGPDHSGQNHLPAQQQAA